MRYDRDLATVRAPFADDGPERTLNRALRDLPGVGRTTASKLFARNRPRLRPIDDAVVTQVLGTKKTHWEPIRQALQPEAGDCTSVSCRCTSEPACRSRSALCACWMSSRGWKGRQPVWHFQVVLRSAVRDRVLAQRLSLDAPGPPRVAPTQLSTTPHVCRPGTAVVKPVIRCVSANL